MLTLGGLYLDAGQRTWELRVRKAVINRAGLSVLNTLSPVRADLWNAEAKLDGRWGRLNYSLGVGADRLEPVGGERKLTGRVFLNLSAPWTQ